MAKPEWGRKHLCQSCGAKFYDLKKEPPTCPSCGTRVDTQPSSRGRRGGRAAASAAKPAEVAAPEPEAEAPEAAPLPEADGEPLAEVADADPIAEEEPQSEESDEAEQQEVDDISALEANKDGIASPLPDDDDEGDNS